MKVLQVIDSLPQGGAEQLLATLAGYIDSANFDLRVCSLHSLDEESPVVLALRSHHIPIYGITGLRWHDPRHVLRVAALVREHRIDLLHTHLPYATTVGILAGVLTHRPVVSTIHSVNDSHQSLGWIKQRLKVWTLRYGARAIIACAPEVGKEAHEHLHLPIHKLKVVPNGIDFGVFATVDPATIQACRWEILGDLKGPLLVTVGNLLPAKGHEHLVTAMSRLLRWFPDARLAIIGRPGHNEALVQERIAALGLEERVMLTGQRNDIPALVAAADVFVLSSLWEGLPLALLEAMATGTPVIATKVGGIPRVVEEGVTGWLVPPGDADALARAMVEVLSKPDKARRLGLAAQTHIQETYGAEAWAQRLQTIYLNVRLGDDRQPSKHVRQSRGSRNGNR